MICRLCLCCEGAMNSIFDMQLQLCEKIHSIANIQIPFNDGLPATICVNCTEKVELFYQFKNLMQTSDNTLKQWLTENFPESAEVPIEDLVINEPQRDKEPEMVNEQLEVAPRIVEVKNTETDIPYYVCLICTLEFTTKGEVLLSHAKTHFAFKGKFQSKPPFTCEFCQILFSDKTKFVEHQRVHMQIKPFNCKQCSREFGTEKLLDDHLNRIAECRDKKLLACRYCGILFKLETDLVQHEEKELATIMFRCSLCDKRFSSLNTHNLHMKYHKDGKQFTCNFCDKSYFTQSQLKMHITCSHNKVKTYECALCDKQFATNFHLNRHMGYHYKLKKFKCRYCWTSFYENHHLKEHIMLRHESTRNIMCDLCGKLFSSQNSLKKHVKNHPTISVSNTRKGVNVTNNPVMADSEALNSIQISNGHTITENAVSTDQEIILITELDNSHFNVDMVTDDNIYVESETSVLDPLVFIVANE